MSLYKRLCAIRNCLKGLNGNDTIKFNKIMCEELFDDIVDEYQLDDRDDMLLTLLYDLFRAYGYCRYLEGVNCYVKKEIED